MSFTPIKLEIVKAVRPDLEGVALDAAVAAISDATAVGYALATGKALKDAVDFVNLEIQHIES